MREYTQMSSAIMNTSSSPNRDQKRYRGSRGRGSGGSNSNKTASAHENQKSARPICGYCEKTGHLEDRCWEKHPQQRPSANQDADFESTKVNATEGLMTEVLMVGSTPESPTTTKGVPKPSRHQNSPSTHPQKLTELRIL